MTLMIGLIWYVCLSCVAALAVLRFEIHVMYLHARFLPPRRQTIRYIVSRCIRWHYTLLVSRHQTCWQLLYSSRNKSSIRGIYRGSAMQQSFSLATDTDLYWSAIASCLS